MSAKIASLTATLLIVAGASVTWALPVDADASTPVVRYEIWVSLDEPGRMLLGKEDIVWTNTSAEPVPDMLIHLYWNAFKNEDSAFLREAAAERRGDRSDAPKEGDWGFVDVTALRLADGSDLLPGLTYVTPDGPAHPHDQTVARVLFPRPVAPGESVRMSVEFRSKIPRTVARSGRYKRSYFIAQWYPKPGVYESGRGWNAHAYHLSSEFFADFADFVVHITVPEDMVVGATGRQTDLWRDDSLRTATYTFRQSMVHDFAWVADPRFLRFERDFSGTKDVSPEEYAEGAALLGLPEEELRLPDLKMILLIAPEHRGQVDRHFRALREAVKYYGLWYGPYPYETVTMVDPPFRTDSGGMEYPTLFTAGTSVLTSRDVLSPEGVIVHEYGHGYWYGLAANNEFEEAWLDEGLNTYSTARVLARAYGPGALDLRVAGWPLAWFLRLPKFYDFELNRAAAIHAVRLDPVTTWSWKFLDRMSYGANVYMRAATLLDTLERLLGERTWARIMRTFQMRFRFRHPTKNDFIAVVNEVSGRDMTWFFEELFESTHAFDYGVADVFSVRLPTKPRGVFDIPGGRTEVKEKEDRAADRSRTEGRPSYLSTVLLRRYGEARVRGDEAVEVLVRFEDGSTERRLWDGQGRWVRLEFVKPVRVTSAQIDPEGKWLIDENGANNSRGVDRLRRNVVKLLSQVVFAVQSLLQFVSSWS